jgi:hypothetical protein
LKNSKTSPISCIRFMKGKVSRIDWDSAIYSTSVVLNVISVWSLLDHVIGHPAYMMT